MSGFVLAPGTPLVLEAGVFALAVLALVVGMARSGSDDRRVGWLVFVGLIVLFVVASAATPGASLFGGGFVVDDLALFAKRLFIGSAALSVLASLALTDGPFVRRSPDTTSRCSPRSWACWCSPRPASSSCCSSHSS